MASDYSSGLPPAKKIVRLGKYEVLQHIATGGMAAIYRARDTEAGREVALKILPPDKAGNQAMVVRFRREYAAASRLKHENIVQLFEMGELNETLYYAMEFVDGTDLHETIEHNGAFDPEEARQIILQAARALRLADQHGIVHRDIKPSNFLLVRKLGKPHVKLTDFGLAREMADDQFRVTRTGTTVGTVDYMSPEQARDSGAADIRSDLYSLGSTWFYLVTGQSPFPEGGLGERLIRLMNDPPPDARVINPQVSDETWAVLSRLLAKDPDDRYQTPEELIDDLMTLQGKAVSSSRQNAAKSHSRIKAVGSRSSGKVKKKEDDDDDEASSATGGNYLPLFLGAACLVLFVVGLLAFLQSRRLPVHEVERTEVTNPPIVGPAPAPQDKGNEPRPVLPTPKELDPTPKTTSKTLPVLYRFVGDRAALLAQADKPWADDATTTDTVVVKVRRGTAEPGWYRTLADAVTAAPMGKPLTIEIHDNGPLFELSLPTFGRTINIRAAAGYRPLIVWDIPATWEKRRADKKLDQPMEFLAVTGGSLRLQGLELVWRYPETLAEPLIVASVDNGDLWAEGCTFSSSARPRESSTLFRVRGSLPGKRVRLDRCHVRGDSLTALELRSPAAEVRLDGCLFSSTQSALLKLACRDGAASHLRLIGSTLIGGQRLIELAGLEESDRRPALNVLAWDTLLAKAGQTPGELIGLNSTATHENIDWKPIASLYAGWNCLLKTTATRADDLDPWRKEMRITEGDGLTREAWPESLDETGVRPAATTIPVTAMRYARSSDPTRPLGCDLTQLPHCHQHWVSRILDGSGNVAAEGSTEADAPEIPSPVGDERFHGGRLDLDSGIDVGVFLEARQKTMKLGPRVVLNLSGKGEKTSSPIRVVGTTLVLHFEEPTEPDGQRLALKMTVGSGGAAIDVDKGGLDIIGGAIRVPDTPRSAYSHVVRVRDGSLRLFRTRIEGPTLSVPEGYVGAVSFGGSGSTDMEKALPCVVHDSIILSSQKGLIAEGIGTRVGVRHSLIVAGDTLAMMPGSNRDSVRAANGESGRSHTPLVSGSVARDDAGAQQWVIEFTSLAARRAVVLLGSASEEVINHSIALRTRDCALLFPFPTKPPRAGLIASEADSLARGLLVWHSERDAIDVRMHYAAWTLGSPLPESKESTIAPAQLFGSYGWRSPRPELIGLRVIDGKVWALERLSLPGREPPGANFSRLGLTRKN